jgi:hypothetical protein
MESARKSGKEEGDFTPARDVSEFSMIDAAHNDWVQ